MTLADLRRLEEAVAVFQQALSTTLYHLQRLDEAEDVLRGAVEIYQHHDLPDKQETVHSDLGRLWLESGCFAGRG